jgi:hypothetical protein
MLGEDTQRVLVEHDQWHMTNGAKLLGPPHGRHVRKAPNMERCPGSPLPYVPDWEQTARRAARIYLAGLAPAPVRDLPGTGLTRADLEAGLTGPAGRSVRRPAP